MPEYPIIPTRSFFYDLSYYGGYGGYSRYLERRNDADAIHIMVDGIEQLGDEKKAFESYTGFDRCHLVYWYEEEDAFRSIGQDTEDLEDQSKFLKLLRDMHYEHCSVCARLWDNNEEENDAN